MGLTPGIRRGTFPSLFGLTYILALLSALAAQPIFPRVKALLGDSILDLRDEILLPLHEYYDMPSASSSRFAVDVRFKELSTGDYLQNNTLFSWRSKPTPVLSWRTDEQYLVDPGNLPKWRTWVWVRNFTLMPAERRGHFTIFCISVSYRVLDGQPLLFESGPATHGTCLLWKFKVVNASLPLNHPERGLSSLLSVSTSLVEGDISFSPIAMQTIGTLFKKFTFRCQALATGQEQFGKLPEMPQLNFDSKSKEAHEMFEVLC